MPETHEPNINGAYQQAVKLYTRLEAQATAANTATAVSALRNLKATKVVVLYDGYGDDGEIGEVQAVDEGDHPIDLDDKVQVHSVRHDGTAYYLASNIQQPLIDLIKDVAGRLVDERHGGWENGEGGRGEVTFDLVEGRILIDHANRFIDEEHSSYEIPL